MNKETEVNENITNLFLNQYVDKNGNICVKDIGDDWKIKDVLKWISKEPRIGSNETIVVSMSGHDGTPPVNAMSGNPSYESFRLEIKTNDLIKLDGNSLLSEYINTKSRFLQGTKQFYFIDNVSSLY